jgi:hypothetical protein
LWHFVSCYQQGKHVNPLGFENEEPDIDEEYKDFLWKLLLVEKNAVQICHVQTLERRITSIKGSTAVKRRRVTNEGLPVSSSTSDGVDLKLSYQVHWLDFLLCLNYGYVPDSNRVF